MKFLLVISMLCKTHWLWEFRRKGSDDRKYVCCSQAKNCKITFQFLVNSFTWICYSEMYFSLLFWNSTCFVFGVEVNTRSGKPDVTPVTPPEALWSKPFGTRKRRDESKATGAIGLTAPKVTTDRTWHLIAIDYLHPHLQSSDSFSPLASVLAL